MSMARKLVMANACRRTQKARLQVGAAPLTTTDKSAVDYG